jgi:uncharacterized protein (DUF302 family)
LKSIDLPLKVPVSEDEGVRVWLSYNSPQYLYGQPQFLQELLGNISGISMIVESAAR